MGHQNPLRTKALTSAMISLSADITAQKLLERQKYWDFVRSFKMALTSFILAPMHHTWFKVQARIFAGKTGPMWTLIKVLVDQAFYTPLVNIAFYTVQTLLSGGSLADAKRTIRAKLIRTLAMAYRVWPLASWINQTYVPEEMRVLFMSMTN